jgi:hypothetical protein
MSSITIKIPEYLRQQLEKMSNEEGVSIDQFFATAASEKLSVIKEIDYIALRAARANDEKFEAVLEHIPASSHIDEWDQMPAK